MATTTEVTTVTAPTLGKIETALVKGDLAALTPEERASYYNQVCSSLGLNPLTKPFDYILLNGKLQLYALKSCTEQLRSIHKISLQIVSRLSEDGVHSVVARATTPDGRFDESVGSVFLPSKPDERANAYMRAECVPLDYEILTQRGFIHPLELEAMENVASVDLDLKIHWTPLQDVSIFENQTVSRWGNANWEAEFTAGHKWLTSRNGSENISLVPFEEMKINDYLYLCGTYEGTDSILTPQEAACLGWIVTDGTVKSYKSKLYRASICQSKEINFEAINWACSGLTGSVTKGVTDNRERNWLDQNWWYLNTKQTKYLFDKAGYQSDEDLPGIAAKLSHEAAVAMLDAMMRADGDKRGTFAKTKKGVVDCVQVLIALTGGRTGHVVERWMHNSTKPLFSTRKFTSKRVNRYNLEKLDERITTVWCPTTNHGTWICRSSEGRVFVTGNTKAKRRVTLSICGLGFMDESETDQLPESAMPQKFEPKQIPAATATASKPLTPRESARLAVRGIVAKSAVLLSHYADKPESGLTDIEADKVIADIKQAGLKISSLTTQQLEGTIFGELVG